MEGQIELFTPPELTVLESKNNEQGEELLKCFKSELISVEYMTLEQLFSGFNTIKAITFSYEIGFINDIMENFDYGEVILGGNFLIQKDTKLNELLAEICTNAYEAGIAIKRYDRLVKLLTEGDIAFRTPSFVLDHRKIYLLRADDGRTRVIKASANMAKKAWNNDHMEHYEYDDSEECYEEYLKDFETAWTMSQAITKDVISSKKADDLLEGNAILKDVKETGRTIVLQQPEGEMSFDNIKYAIDHEAIKEQYKAVLEGAAPKNKSGLFEIIPKTLEKIIHNQRKLAQSRVQINNITEHYPALTLDLYNKEALLNGEPLDLSPSEEEVRQDIDELLRMYSNFNQFVASDIEKLKRVHFKLMNAIFCSPLNAKFRCTAKIMGKPASSLPLFVLVSSETSNSGKTFMIKAALKMMTGKELDGMKACDYTKDNIRTTQLGVKSVPFFVDEVNNKFISNIKDIIKNPEKCEDNQLEQMPMIIFASNDVLKPEEPIRKRMVFFTIDGALPSTIDKTAFESKGKVIIRKLGTAFYREYLRRLLGKAQEELDFLIHSKDIADDYYPDLTGISSEVIVSILEEYGYEIPSYMGKLSWRDDYSQDSNAEDAVTEFGEFCKANRALCSFTKNSVIIELGADKESKKKIDSWKNILPAEMKPTVQTTRECSKIIVNKKELEARLGYKLGGLRLFGRK